MLFGELLGQVLAKSNLEIMGDVLSYERPAPVDVVSQALRRLSERRPVICVIDDADQAATAGLWADLILGTTPEPRERSPLVVVLAVDGPVELGAHEDDEPDILYTARRLVSAGSGSWHPLAPVDAEALGSWTGPAAPDVLAALHALTRGRSAWAAEMWRDWRRRGVVEDMSEGRWRFATGSANYLDDAADLLDERLRRLSLDQGVEGMLRTSRMLACAALEGRRFTPAAVAHAIGRSVNDMIDFLDDMLIFDAEHPEGLVVDDGWITVDDERGLRHVAVYHFARELDWLALRHHGLSAVEQGTLSRRLADALAAVYGGRAHSVAHTLTRLYEAAGEHDRARHYRRMADAGASREVILSRARAALKVHDPEDRAERRRACRMQIDAATELRYSGPFTEGLAFAQHAAHLSSSRHDQATALFLVAHHRSGLGEYEDARRDFRRALELHRELDDRAGEAATRHQLARIDLEQGAYESARSELMRVLGLQRELGDRPGEAAVRHHLARIDVEQGDYEDARAELLRVLELQRELGDQPGEGATRHALASIELEQGNYEHARTEFMAVLRLRRELGDSGGEAAARHQLASIDLRQGSYQRARAEFTRVLDLRRDLGDRSGEAATRHQLATIDVQQGDYERARAEFTSLLGLCRELGDRHGEGVVIHQLASIDVDQGAYERARSDLTRLLTLWRELGDRGSEASTRHELARVALAQGEHEQARLEFSRALKIWRELGVRSGEELARAALDALPSYAPDAESAAPGAPPDTTI